MKNYVTSAAFNQPATLTNAKYIHRYTECRAGIEREAMTNYLWTNKIRTSRNDYANALVSINEQEI